MTTERNIIIHQGQAFALSLPYAGTAGRGQRMHIRLADSTATVVQILTHNGDANARVLFDGAAALDITIGASVSAGWVVLADRVEWVYDIEDYDLADEDDTVIPYRGKVIVRGNRTRASDVTPSDQMPSGDGRYVRFDGEQNLTPEQMAQAQINILGEEYAPGGGSGDVVGPASATDDRIAAFDGVTGKLIKQGGVTATAVASHLSSTSNPHSVTAAQVGADAAGTAATAVAAHAVAADPHGDRSFATSAVSTHAALTTGAHGITAAGAALLDDADAAAQRTTLGLGTAATTAATAYEASGAVATHNAVTTAHGISAYGATLVDDADAATARTTLGLGTAATSATGDFATAGHNHSGVYQQSDAELTAIAGLTSAADSAPYFTGSGTAALMTVTAAGRALIDDADASAQRTTLGLGTAATTAASAYATAAQGTDDRTASGLRTASTVVSVSAATAPSSGQVLTATSSTAATWQTPSAGSGDVAGPASATDNAIARFDATTGKLIQNTSNVTIADTGALSITPDANAKAITVASHTHTTSNPAIDVAQTWNAGAVTFTGWKFNVTDTASAAASLLVDLQVAGSSKFSVKKNGDITIPASGIISSASGSLDIRGGSGTAGLVVGSNAYSDRVGITAGALSIQDVYLAKDASDVLAQRRTTAAQTSRVYGTYTDASNYVRISTAATSTATTITAETAGTGADNVPLTLSAAGTESVIAGSPFKFKSYTVATLPSASAAGAGAMIYVTDESGGAVPAFSDGTNWRRVTDRAVVS